MSGARDAPASRPVTGLTCGLVTGLACGLTGGATGRVWRGALARGGDPPEPPDHGGAARPPVPPWPPLDGGDFRPRRPGPWGGCIVSVAMVFPLGHAASLMRSAARSRAEAARGLLVTSSLSGRSAPLVSRRN